MKNLAIFHFVYLRGVKFIFTLFVPSGDTYYALVMLSYPASIFSLQQLRIFGVRREGLLLDAVFVKSDVCLSQFRIKNKSGAFLRILRD